MRSLFVALGFILVGATSEAQPHWAIGGTAGWFATAGRVDSPLSPALGGSALSGALFADRIIARRVSVGAELSLMADLKGRQTQNTSTAFLQYRTRHRDNIALAMVKAGVVQRGAFHLELVSGAGTAWRHTVHEGTAVSREQVAGIHEKVSSVVLAEAVGLDCALLFGSKTALVWSGRFTLMNDHASGARGVPSTGLRFGGGILRSF